MSASVLDVLAALPAGQWITPSWVAQRFQLTNYAARQLLGLLDKRGLVDKGSIDPEGRRQYRINVRGRQALQQPTKVMDPDRFWERRTLTESHRYARRTKKGRVDPDEYARRRVLFEMRKREGT